MTACGKFLSERSANQITLKEISWNICNLKTGFEINLNSRSLLLSSSYFIFVIGIVESY